MDKLIKISILFDFYGKLLSKKQYDVIDMYYNNDLSLSEVAQEMDTSRQAVFDTLKRAEEKLIEYENILGLAEKFYNTENSIKDIEKLVKEIMAIGSELNNSKILELAQNIDLTIKKILY
ncbi:MAG: hypothetical protein H5T96_02525 [Tissierellales bacterium]|nr:hypothetical protein [Tissierellales bacterium]